MKIYFKKNLTITAARKLLRAAAKNDDCEGVLGNLCCEFEIERGEGSEFENMCLNVYPFTSKDLDILLDIKKLLEQRK